MLPFFQLVFDTGSLSNHRVTRRCLVKNAVPTTENWPLQINYLAYPDKTIYNKRMIQFSLVHLGSIVVMFSVVYWLLVAVNVCFSKIMFIMHQSLRCMSPTSKLPKNCSFVGFWSKMQFQNRELAFYKSPF